MTELVPGSSVSIESPQVSLDVYSPHFVNGVLVKEGQRGLPGPAGSVDTVNGKPGPDPVLDAADVGAAPADHEHDASDITSGVIAPARLGTGTPDGTTVLYGNGTWGAPSGGGGTALLALVQYNPGSQATRATSSTTPVDADATNLVVTFTAPASGAVLVRLSARASGPAASTYFWTLRDAAGQVAGAVGRVLDSVSGSLRISHPVRISGLTPSASYTWKWAHYVSSSTGQMFAGGVDGPAIMEVWSA